MSTLHNPESTPTWDQVWMSVAATVATRSSSLLPAGAVVARGNRIISAAPHSDLLCSVTAALLHAGRDARGAMLYVTDIVPLSCVEQVSYAGIERVLQVVNEDTDMNILTLVENTLRVVGVAVARVRVRRGDM